VRKDLGESRKEIRGLVRKELGPQVHKDCGARGSGFKSRSRLSSVEIYYAELRIVRRSLVLSQRQIVGCSSSMNCNRSIFSKNNQ